MRVYLLILQGVCLLLTTLTCMADSPLPANIPVIRNNPSGSSQHIGWEWGLVLILLLFGLIWLNKQIRNARPENWFSRFKSDYVPDQTAKLTIKDRKYLSSQTSLVVIEWQSKDYLVVLHPQGATLIDQIDNNKDVEASSAKNAKS